MSKKRRVNQLSVVHEDPSSFAHWKECDLSTAFDAPTVRLGEGGENLGSANNFSNLGSVLAKLDTFMTHRNPTTLSTVPSLVSAGALVPSTGPVGDNEVASLEGVEGYTQKILIETDSPAFFDKFSPIYDQLNFFHSKKCNVRELVVAMLESGEDMWTVLEIPGPFNTLGYVQVRSSNGQFTCTASGIQLRGDKSLLTELESCGVCSTVVPVAVQSRIKNKASEGSSSDEESTPQIASVKIEGRVDIFGFFDCLINEDVFADPRRPASVFSSFAFNDAVSVFPSVSVKDSGKTKGFKFVQIERICCPLHVLEWFIDSNLTSGTARTHFQQTPSGASINLVKRI